MPDGYEVLAAVAALLLIPPAVIAYGASRKRNQVAGALIGYYAGSILAYYVAANLVLHALRSTFNPGDIQPIGAGFN